jgi:hypothetical protein
MNVRAITNQANGEQMEMFSISAYSRMILVLSRRSAPGEHCTMAESLFDYAWLLHKTNRAWIGNEMLIQAHACLVHTADTHR